MNAQLRQVVYAATEFPSVKSVQILIEGTKVRYLGTEGMRMDTPLSRAHSSKLLAVPRPGRGPAPERRRKRNSVLPFLPADR